MIASFSALGVDLPSIGHGPNPEKGLFLCSLQHFGDNLNTRDLQAQGSVEYKNTKFP